MAMAMAGGGVAFPVQRSSAALLSTFSIGCFPTKSWDIFVVNHQQMHKFKLHRQSCQHMFSSKPQCAEIGDTIPFNLDRNSKADRQPKVEMAFSQNRRANLVANKSASVPLPTFVDSLGKPQPLSKFLQQRAGMESVLNTKALQQCEQIGSNVFRCFLQKVEILNFEVAPIVDLRVITTNNECIVEMLSCKFEGSEVVESQNKHFSASMRNHLTWNGSLDKKVMDVKVELNVSLEIYTLPFTLLPISAVEAPGNVIMQALLDRLVPLFLDQLFDDYKRWTLICASDVEMLGLTSHNTEE
ncbi:hypothetical protein O6H91_11G089500 [Diphasiastrum complanatum]|uniref:Uncharacterized protein n=2 Tax=Diphasiastrum complanatum TaxID=34168 RepID=A0ACC2CBH0_DIPCM|nr:hypothetical protein O6H91_11G089500 [Diphasiastrum complanatum]